MALQTATRDLATTEFHRVVSALGLPQCHVARLFSVSPRHIRRWKSGTRRLPHAVGIVCNLLTTGVVTIEQVEAAAPVPARTNGGANPEPSAPLLVTPAPVPALADPGLSIAQKVCALTSSICRWPHGDPQCPGFHFCGRPAVTQPYCEQHRVMAYLARSLSEARPGFRCSPPAPAASSAPWRGSMHQGAACC